MCKSVQPLLAGGSLTALLKRDNGIRPIAVGDVLRRLTGKALVRAQKAKIVAYFSPLQVGVAVPCGAEAVVHGWKIIMDMFSADPDIVAVKVDFDNAFNNANRAEMLRLCLQHFPELYGYAWFCYCEPSSLYLQGYDTPEVVQSRQGTQQGCPFGSFLYCLILHKLVMKIAERCPTLKLHTWFMDDGSIIGKTEVVKRAWDIIVEEGPADGLFANQTKSELVWPLRCPQSLLRL